MVNYLDNTGWRAAHEIFGSGLRHLLCRWHLDKYVCSYISIYAGIKVNDNTCFAIILGHGETIFVQRLVHLTNLKSIKHSVYWRVSSMKEYLKSWFSCLFNTGNKRSQHLSNIFKNTTVTELVCDQLCFLICLIDNNIIYNLSCLWCQDIYCIKQTVLLHKYINLFLLHTCW